MVHIRDRLWHLINRRILRRYTAYKPVYIHPSARISKGTRIGAFCDIGKNVVIGKDCTIECHVTISNSTKIGDRVFIGPNTSLLNRKYPRRGIEEPAIVDDDVIIGGGATILPRVRIGCGAFVGAGSVVTKDVCSGQLVYGNPARPRNLIT